MPPESRGCSSPSRRRDKQRKRTRGRPHHQLIVLGLHLRAGCTVGRHEVLACLGRGCIASRGQREAVGKRRRKQHGGGGPRLGSSHGRIQYLAAGCQNPVTAAGCPATGTGTGSLFCPTGMRGEKNAGRGTWPAVESWIDWLHIHQTRPNVSAAWVPWRVVNICTADCGRLQKVSWQYFSPSPFCFSRVPSVFQLTSLSSSVPIPTIRWTRVYHHLDISQMF